MAEPTLSASDYTETLRELAPPGALWGFVPAVGLGGFVNATAEELARLHALVASIVAEANPCTCDALLPEWLEVAGLPDPAWQEEPATDAESKAALSAYVSVRGSMFAANLEAHVLRTLGITISIVSGSYTAFECDVSECDVDAIYDGAEAFLFDVEYPAALASDALDRLECFIHRFKPGHAVPNFVAV